ncbi:PEPxxWA-CTERM sorting domain-containing protein [Phenylobacterium sp.]|uniref:PEPxxWA-CTERM sorting domain-containing protein n=1 Tax=Phenylobacterium sp. TaxID=1871053 RepID=UPI00301E3D58
MKRLAFAAAALAATAFAGSAGAASNLVLNGSFEESPLGLAWTYEGSGADVPGHQAVIIPYNSGASYPGGAFGEPIPPDNSDSASPDAVGEYAAYFVADNSTEKLSQMVWLDPGLYTIGFSVYVPFNGFNNSGDASFTATVAGQSFATFNVDGSTPGQWVHYAGVANILTAGEYETSFTYVSGPAPAGDFVVDRVYIVAGNAIPEPGAWALMILGFGGAGAALRRNRRLAFAG